MKYLVIFTHGKALYFFQSIYRTSFVHTYIHCMPFYRRDRQRPQSSICQGPDTCFVTFTLINTRQGFHTRSSGKGTLDLACQKVSSGAKTINLKLNKKEKAIYGCDLRKQRDTNDKRTHELDSISVTLHMYGNFRIMNLFHNYIVQ